MKKIFRLFATAILAIGASLASAANYHSVKITLTDQSEVYLDFDDEFNISFTPEEMQLVNSENEVRVPRSQIATMVFSGEKAPEDSGVNEVESERPRLEGDRMTFNSLPAGSQIRVVDVAGHTILGVEAEGYYVLDLSALGKGIFIVTVNNSQTYKLNLK